MENFTAAFAFEEVMNLSSSKSSLQKCKWGHFNTAITVLLFLTFILNVLASFVLFRVPLTTVRGKSNPVYFCIRFLNVCDVLQAAFLVIMPAFSTSDCEWIGGDTSCSIMGFFVLFFILISPLITILMAFDRVVALYLPFKYRSQLGLKMLKILLPSSCVFVMLITMLPIFGIGKYHVVKGRRFCLLDTITEDTTDRRYVVVVHAIFLIALLFMLSCTVAIQLKLCLMSLTKKELQCKDKFKKKVASRRTRNATLTAMAVCAIFFLCYMPYVVRVLIEATTRKKSSTIVTWVTFAMAFTQSLLNPIVCIVTNTRFRQELVALVKNIKVLDVENSSEFNSEHKRPLSMSGFRQRLSSKGNRNSAKKEVRNQSRIDQNGGSTRSPSSPRPYMNGIDDPLLQSPAYISDEAKHRNGIVPSPNSIPSTVSSPVPAGSPSLELFSFKYGRNSSSSSGDNSTKGKGERTAL